MPITPTNPFKGRQFPGEVIVLCVRWYLRYPLSYEHVSELLAERGVEVDPSCIWRWVQAYAPELNKRCCIALTTSPVNGASLKTCFGLSKASRKSSNADAGRRFFSTR